MYTEEALFKLAVSAAGLSEDPRTHVGAVLYNYDTRKILRVAANCFSRGFSERDLEYYDKYDIITHAERNVIEGYFRDRPREIPRLGLAVTAACCKECAKTIVGAGIIEVITSGYALELMPSWRQSIDMGHRILLKGGVNLRLLNKMGTKPVKMSGEYIIL